MKNSRLLQRSTDQSGVNRSPLEKLELYHLSEALQDLGGLFIDSTVVWSLVWRRTIKSLNL